MTTDLPLLLDRAASTPLAAQLADALRGAATVGALRPGDKLPSTRELAARLGVSRTVTAAAYDQLVAEGWASGRAGSGTFVTASVAGAAVVPAQPSTGTREPAGGVDLRTGRPWAAGIESAAWRRAWRAAADAAPLRKPVRGGLPEFGLAVSTHLLRHRGLAATGEVIATGGTTVAVAELVAAGVLPRGSTVAVEEPGYQRAVEALRAGGVRVVPAPVDADGLDVDRLPRGIDGVYCSPAHQFPLGGRLPAARRLALVQRARAEGFLVVEDDYDGELRFDMAALPLLASLAPDVVVHLGTTSKILTPSLGVGWLVAPPAVVAAVLAHREVTGTGPSPAGQLVFVALAESGDLARHLRRLRRELAARRAVIVDALNTIGRGPGSGGSASGAGPGVGAGDGPGVGADEEPGIGTDEGPGIGAGEGLGDEADDRAGGDADEAGGRGVGARGPAVVAVGDEAGAHVVVELPHAEAEAAVMAEMAAAGFTCAGLREYHAGEPTRFGLPIGYAGCDRADLEAAAPLLVAAVARAVRG